jgi:pimeloyl-ACP methyl ester carboxylesterase
MTVESTTGVRIAYDISGSGRTVVLLHGFGNSRSMWTTSGWVAKLEKDFTVATIDLRGCGQSDKPESPSDYLIEAHLADIESVVRVCGQGNPIVWGWSLGATVALHLASRGKASATIAAGTYFGPIFTQAFVDSRTAASHSELDRARLRGMGTWPALQPNEVKGRLLVYTGTNDGNVVKQLGLQREAIEAAGGHLKVLSDCNHLQLVSEADKVASVVLPFINQQC